MSDATTAPVTVFACGELHRGDDAAAFHALDRLAPAVRRRLHIVRAGQLDVQDLLDLAPDAECIVIDAVAGFAPGRILRAPLDDIPAMVGVARRPARARSTHQLPLEQTLALAALLRGAALRGSFIGLGGASFAPGSGLSPAVAAAIPAFSAALAAEADRLHGAATAAGAP
jgi:hydrogenase maturation protease